MHIALAAEPVMITVSDDRNKVIFDGKWSFYTEWKRSSLDTLSYDDGTLMYLRTAHQGNFIYIFIDVVSETKFNKNNDMAYVCFDKHDVRPMIANQDDYCFLVPLGKDSFVLQGGSPLQETGNFKKISNPDGFIGVGSISDENDRYTSIPHPSYEFKIPTEVVGRSDAYGFYVGVYDSHVNKIYSWPQDIVVSLLRIPSPNQWGELISPDRSLPEFGSIVGWITAISLIGSLVISRRFSKV